MTVAFSKLIQQLIDAQFSPSKISAFFTFVDFEFLVEPDLEKFFQILIYGNVLPRPSGRVWRWASFFKLVLFRWATWADRVIGVGYDYAITGIAAAGILRGIMIFIHD